MKRYFGIVTLIIFVLFIFVAFFYWFQWRPAQVRKNCEFAVFGKGAALYGGTMAVRQNNKYRQCLIRNGLAPESIFVNSN